MLAVSRQITPEEVICRLDAGRTVAIAVSRTKMMVGLIASILIGVFLAVFLVLMVTSSLEQGTSWSTIAIHPVVLACLVGAPACLLLAPLAQIIRMRRLDNLVLTRAGIAQERRGLKLPGSFLPWSDIEDITFETLSRHGRLSVSPKYVTYHFSPEVIAQRGLRGMRPDIGILQLGYEIKPRLLFVSLSTVHSRYTDKAW